MKRFLATAVFCFIVVLSGFSQKANHVILISIDGFRPDFYLDKSWQALNLQNLLAGGVYAKGVNSVFPSVTYPAHTSLITGALPATHGIYYNSPFGAAPGQWYWEESLIKAPTLWDAVKKAGLTSGSVMWPVTVGAPIDYNFPVRRAEGNEKADQLSITRPLTSPKGLIEQIEKSTGNKFTKADFNDHHLDITIGKMANYIIANHRPNLMAVHFVSIDHLEHEFGRDGKEVRAGVAQVDSLIGAILAAVEQAGLKQNTAIIITGDHGFANTRINISPNVLLAQNGLLTKDNWQAKFLSVGGSSFLYLKDKKDVATLQKVKKILADMPADQKKLFRVVEQQELKAIGANPEVRLALAGNNGVVFGGGMEGEVVRPVKKGGSHGYFPDFPDIQTGFIATGTGINKGVVIPEMNIVDVAPVISQLLDLPFKAPDGKLLPHILKK